ncbi:hypothetical protein EVAR_94031_1 [Eumeta japonica]|uniref:Uncharacterized protein n=1 Tax=Eumeta variegata TaxID=151549 RepID=A0A4C1SYD5_EUMVA|nr:hypothetical protein EVAR_94031_1 [Eumeta japonica]
MYPTNFVSKQDEGTFAVNLTVAPSPSLGIKARVLSTVDVASTVASTIVQQIQKPAAAGLNIAASSVGLAAGAASSLLSRSAAAGTNLSKGRKIAELKSLSTASTAVGNVPTRLITPNAVSSRMDYEEESNSILAVNISPNEVIRMAFSCFEILVLKE